MKFYCVARLEITNQEWVPEYVQRVTGMIEKHGGRYLARTPRAERWEGEGDSVSRIFLLVEWPSREAAEAFYRSEEYQPFLERRLAGSHGELFFVPGEDITGAARVPE